MCVTAEDRRSNSLFGRGCCIQQKWYIYAGQLSNSRLPPMQVFKLLVSVKAINFGPRFTEVIIGTTLLQDYLCCVSSKPV